MDAQQPESQRLRRDVEWALRRALDPMDVLPLLHRLARTAPEGSDESVFAHRQLAELLVERHAWRATLHARRALAARPDDDRAWAVLALCQTMLGNYRYAVSSYHHALMCAPKNPWYAHNLGHLLDVALERPADALFWLRTAYAGAAHNGEIAASFSHALARAGKLGEAKRVLGRAMKRGASREQTALWKWLEDGAPADQDSPRPRATPITTAANPLTPCDLTERAITGRAITERATTDRDGPDASVAPIAGVPPSARNALSHPTRRGRHHEAANALSKTPSKILEAALARGLAKLPVDASQRLRARDLARDVVERVSDPALNPTPNRRLDLSATHITSLAAAIAYAILYVDHVPLTQTEVAACFRVSAASVRGRFKQLRAMLDLTPGDKRYGTPRRP
jgi:tetratricopeptide (TPR) repeat protein